MKIEFKGGPKDGETLDLGQPPTTLDFPVLPTCGDVFAPREPTTRPIFRRHRYQLAEGFTADYYAYRGME